ncbi:hypothetical protein ACWXVQ_02645 [Mycoplasma sp. 527]
MAKKIKLVLGFLPVITIAPLVASCSQNLEKLKYNVINSLKNDIINLLANVDALFGSSKNEEVIKLKDEISNLLRSLKEEKITHENNIDVFINKAKQKFKNLVQKFADMYNNNTRLVSEFFEELSNFSQWTLDNLINVKYTPLILKIKKYLQDHVFRYDWNISQITKEISKLKAFEQQIKKEKEQIDIITKKF